MLAHCCGTRSAAHPGLELPGPPSRLLSYFTALHEEVRGILHNHLHCLAAGHVCAVHSHLYPGEVQQPQGDEAQQLRARHGPSADGHHRRRGLHCMLDAHVCPPAHRCRLQAKAMPYPAQCRMVHFSGCDELGYEPGDLHLGEQGDATSVFRADVRMLASMCGRQQSEWRRQQE